MNLRMHDLPLELTNTRHISMYCIIKTSYLTTFYFVTLLQVPVNDDQRLAQKHCISTIVTGARKTLSNVATVELYETSLKGIRQYHKAKLGDIEIDGKKEVSPSCASPN